MIVRDRVEKSANKKHHMIFRKPCRNNNLKNYLDFYLQFKLLLYFVFFAFVVHYFYDIKLVDLGAQFIATAALFHVNFIATAALFHVNCKCTISDS